MLRRKIDGGGPSKTVHMTLKSKWSTKMSVASVNKTAASTAKQTKRQAVKGKLNAKSPVKTRHTKRQILQQAVAEEEEVSPMIPKARSRSRSTSRSPEEDGEVLVEVEGQETDYVSEMEDPDSDNSKPDTEEESQEVLEDDSQNNNATVYDHRSQS